MTILTAQIRIHRHHQLILHFLLSPSLSSLNLFIVCKVVLWVGTHDRQTEMLVLACVGSCDCCVVWRSVVGHPLVFCRLSWFFTGRREEKRGLFFLICSLCFRVSRCLIEFISAKELDMVPCPCHFFSYSQVFIWFLCSDVFRGKAEIET